MSWAWFLFSCSKLTRVWMQQPCRTFFVLVPLTLSSFFFLYCDSLQTMGIVTIVYIECGMLNNKRKQKTILFLDGNTASGT